jgi:hypothetical protein
METASPAAGSGDHVATIAFNQQRQDSNRTLSSADIQTPNGSIKGR